MLIVSDTFRWDNLYGRFTVKNGVRVRTPNLSRLADDSIVFTRAYHASFPTVPNRLDLMTGRFTYTYYDWSPMPRDELVIAEMLKEKDYVSMMVADTPHILKDGYFFDKGFDGWVWIRGQENDRYRTDPLEVKLPCSPEKLRNVKTTVQHLRNNALRRFEEDWIPARTASEAIRWLEKNHGRKFFLYVDFFDPHEPWDPPKWYVDMYDPGYDGEEVIYPVYGPCGYLTRSELEHCRAMYAGEVTLVDKWIGRLLEKVEELGLYENTAVIFTADHGFYLGEHGLIGKSIIMGKYHGLAPLYEEVCHIPLLLRPPDSLGLEPRRMNALVQTPDITATVLELAGVEKPSRVQGSSLLSLARGERETLRSIAVSTPSLIRGVRAGLRATLVSDRWSLILAPEAPVQEVDREEYTMIVDGEPRVLHPFGRIQTELYDLSKDPRQKHNLAIERPEVVERLHGMFIGWLRKIGASEDIIRPWLKLRLPADREPVQ